MMTEDLEQFLLALSNGIVSVAGMIGICETHVVIQTLTKALAGESVKKNFKAFLEARANNDVATSRTSTAASSPAACWCIMYALPKKEIFARMYTKAESLITFQQGVGGNLANRQIFP